MSSLVFARSWSTIGWTRADFDLTDGKRVTEAVMDTRPWAIVNCAGYNLVDDAEDHPMAALDANAFVVRSLAGAAARVNAAFVQYSSDFVFDGEAQSPYTEDDRPNPRSVYAASKLLGEWFASDAPAHYVLRVESLFGGATRQKGTLDTFIDAIAAGRPVRAFTDRVVSPSYVWDVAEATASLLRTRPAPGLYHCVNSGAASWFEVATEVRRQLGSDATLEPTTTTKTTLRAARPRYCALSNEKLRAAGVVMPAGRTRCAARLRRGKRLAATEITEEAGTIEQSKWLKRALITGMTGQDGSYLAELLLDKGYEGLRHRPPLERAERVAHSAPARSDHAAAGRPARPAVAHQGGRDRGPGRGLQPGGDVVRARVVGSADADRRVQLTGRDPRARGDPPREPQDPLLPGVVERDVRRASARCRRPS